MTEQLRTPEDEQKLSRRDLFRQARYVMTVAAIAATANKLTEGISLSKPPLVLQTVSVSRIGEDVRLLSENSPEADSERVMTITPEGKLLFDPSGEFFTPVREFSYIHRANSIQVIYVAHNMGANLFDIDANDVNGIVYGEHGIVPQLELNLGKLGVTFQIPAVLDQNEMELKLGMPDYKYEDLVAYVASLSTVGHPLAVSTELKRGKFSPNTLNKMLDIHSKYNIPVIMHTPDTHYYKVISDAITPPLEL